MGAGSYFNEGLVAANRKMAENVKWSKDNLLVARSDKYLYLYNSFTDAYEILDKEDLVLINSFDNFLQILMDYEAKVQS